MKKIAHPCEQGHDHKITISHLDSRVFKNQPQHAIKKGYMDKRLYTYLDKKQMEERKVA